MDVTPPLRVTALLCWSFSSKAADRAGRLTASIAPKREMGSSRSGRERSRCLLGASHRQRSASQRRPDAVNAALTLGELLPPQLMELSPCFQVSVQARLLAAVENILTNRSDLGLSRSHIQVGKKQFYGFSTVVKTFETNEQRAKKDQR